MEAAEIAVRLERLERQNRLMKRVSIATLALVAAVFLLAQAAPKTRTLEAESFVLKDTDGKDRAVLGRLSANSFGLALLDKEGKRRAVMSFDDMLGSPFLNLRDKDKARRLTMLLLNDGTPALSMRDGKGKTLAAIGCLPQNLQGALPAWFPDVRKDFPTSSTPSGFLEVNTAEGKTLFKAP